MNIFIYENRGMLGGEESELKKENGNIGWAKIGDTTKTWLYYSFVSVAFSRNVNHRRAHHCAHN